MPMKRLQLRPLYIIIGILAIAASVILTYSSFRADMITLSYLVDTLIIILLLVLLFNKNTKTRKSIEHNNYMEWITDGRIESCSKLSVGIISLEDLVKLAIDLKSRVIHDARLGKYFVLTEDMTYIHDPSLASTLENKQQLGKLLVEHGMLQQEQLETGLYYQKKIGCKLGESLIALGFIDETILFSTLAAQQNISYYELDAGMYSADTEWEAKISINKAKALQVLPLGKRVDGKYVIACGETVRPGITAALKEAFGSEIYIVAARPSKIYEILDKLEREERQKSDYILLRDAHKVEAYERLTDKEWEQFTQDYYSGRINTYLLIKAIGIVDQIHMAKAPHQEILLGWLTSHGLISGQMINLMKAFEKLVRKQNKNSREQRVMLQLPELLKEAFYLTEETKNWVINENKQTNIPVKQLLESNYLVASETLEFAELILLSIKSILNKATIF